MYLEMGGKYNNEYFKRKIFVNNIQIKKIRNEFNNTDVIVTAKCSAYLLSAENTMFILVDCIFHYLFYI